MKIIHLIVLSLLISTGNLALSQTTVNVEYGDDLYNGGGVVGDGTIWNFFSGTSGSTIFNLQTSTGDLTEISVTATYGSRFFGGDAGSSPAGLLGSGLYGPYSFTISGLDISTSYDLYLYVYNKSNEPTVIEISTPGGGTKTPSPVNNRSSFVLDQNYVVFSGLSPDTNGQIIGSVSGAWTGLNGFQLQSVPEPTTTAFLGLAFALTVCGARVFGKRK